MKTLISVNYEHKKYNLKRFKFESIAQYTALSAVIYNFRSYIHKLGFDCSLLNDSEIMGFEGIIFIVESINDDSYLVEILEFLSKNENHR